MRIHRWSHGAGAILVLSFWAFPLSGATNAVTIVPGNSDPYLAGMPNGTLCCTGDSAPAQSPVQVTGLTLASGTVLTFTVTGSVNNGVGPPTDPPDGGALIGAPANDGIAGINAPLNSLVGVFLDNSQPDSTAAPATLDFSPGGLGTSFSTLSPGLKQVFFIGDGLTGNGTGAQQRFVVPAGATRFFLGTDDGFGWYNNTGAFNVTAVLAPVASVPTIGTSGLIAFGTLLAGLGVWALSRR